MDPTFTNEEQINLCKEKVHDKYFGEFTDVMANVRDSSLIHYGNCLTKAGNSLESAVTCINQYLDVARQDNEKIATRFAVDYEKYM